MCSICPRCSPPRTETDPDAAFGPLSPILPAPIEPIELTDEDWSKIRRFEFSIGGLICSCPPDEQPEPEPATTFGHELWLLSEKLTADE